MDHQPSPQNTFLLEADDLLDQIEDTVLAMEDDDKDADRINHLFRAFHTLKGSGAMFGFDTVAAFTHHVETVLDQVRSGNVPVTRHLLDLLLASKDHIGVLLAAAGGGPPPAAETAPRIIAELNALLLGNEGSNNGTTATAKAGPKNRKHTAPSGAQPQRRFRIQFRPPPNVMAIGLDPAALLEELRSLGSCDIRLLAEEVPPLDTLNPDQCHLAWDIAITTVSDLNAVRDVFIFVADGSQLEITPLADAAPVPEAVPPPPPLPSRNEAAKPATPPDREPRPAKTATANKEAMARVPAEKLDRLVSLVGELVVNQSRLSRITLGLNLPDLSSPMEEFERQVAELRDIVLGIRMMPIGSTFSRFKRLVRDLSSELGKEIDLVTEGAETELDKTVIDQLSEPLVHLIRNSVDHGIDLPEERLRQGKSRRGTIRLAAAHEGAHVLITIQDDGQGLNLDVIRAKAIEKKFLPPDAQPSRAELINLIMMPGFSTARQVTSVSGRGVGMDVVKRQIESLRGSVHIESQLGCGTTLTLTLPLTLAIIEGLMVEVQNDQFIIPMSTVMENVELLRSQRSGNNGRNLVTVRGELIPYIRLRDHFTIPGAGPEIEKIVIVRFGGVRVGLVVDRVLGSHQTVIQSLGRFYRDVAVVSGSTIMGDGRVALILDLAGLVKTVEEQQQTTEPTLTLD